jgi:hypothetical protein
MTCNFDGAATNNSLPALVNAGSTILAQYNALNFTLTSIDKILVTDHSFTPRPSPPGHLFRKSWGMFFVFLTD